MALIVTVSVNDRQILDTHVVRIKGKPHERCTYQLFVNRAPVGVPFSHHYDDGAEELVVKMMKRIKKIHASITTDKEN